MKRANELIKLNVFVCEGSLSLDRDYLEGLASGKFEVAERTVHLDEEAASELKRSAAVFLIVITMTPF